MKQLINIILIAIVTAIGSLLLSWWMIAVVPFLYVVFFRVPKPFLTGFCGIALLWLIWILISDIANEHILSGRMTMLFGLPHYSLLIIVNLLIGGLIGGLAAFSGYKMNKAFRNR